jgi:hypothetical protein
MAITHKKKHIQESLPRVLTQVVGGKTRLSDFLVDDDPQDPLHVLADPKRWADYLLRYRFSKV